MAQSDSKTELEQILSGFNIPPERKSINNDNLLWLLSNMYQYDKDDPQFPTALYHIYVLLGYDFRV